MRQSLLFTALCAAVFLAYRGCGNGASPAKVPVSRPSGGLAFSFTDVAGQLGYTMRNRTGKDGVKEYILEAMPPGIAVADFDGDGWMDLYCPNGNDITRYDPKTKKVTMLPRDTAPRNELYFNRGGERFEPRGKEAGVDDHLWSFGTVAGDIDNDGDADLYVCNWGQNRLYLNDGKGKFTEVAGRLGAAGDPRDWSTGACLIDYDRDGDLDIYVAQYADVYNILSRPDVTTVLGDGRITGRNCEWKKLKVYCGPLGLRPLNDVLLKNELVETGELRFTNVTKPSGVWIEYDARSATESSHGPYYGFQPVSWDIDGNGWPDIFVANDSVANVCWMNNGDGTFEDKAPQMSLDMSMSDYNPQASMGVAVGDINRDGLQDLLVTEFSHDQFNLLLGERLESGLTVFNERAAKTGMRALTFKKLGWGALLFDPDLDGDLDFFFACGHVYPEVNNFPAQETTYKQTNLLVLNEEHTRPKIRDVSAIAGPGLALVKTSRAAVVVDFDNDGDPDIATTEINDSPSLLRCDLAVKHHWVSFLLRGDPAAKIPLDPAGAQVTVTAGDLVQTRVLMFGSSFQCSEDPRLLFGLGLLDKVDSVEILWPNGETTELRDVPVDQVHKVRFTSR